MDDPAGRHRRRLAARLGAALSRLDPLGDAPELGSFFPDWESWPDTLARATFEVHYGSASAVVGAGTTDGPDRVDTTLGGPDPAAWQALFAADLFVRGFQFKDLADNKVLSYDAAAMAELVTDLYRELGRSADGELPTVTDIVDRPGWRSVMGAVAQIDRRYHDRKERLRDPRRMFDDFLHDELPIREGVGADLARFQLFHNPPARPRPVTHTRTDDARITARWLEYERKPLPSAAELVKEIDFHQVVAAMNQYPTLLRRLGLVVDLVLDRRPFADAPDAPLWTEVTFAQEALQVPRSRDVSPVTHVRLADRAFHAVSNPNPAPEELRVKAGLLDLDPKRFQLLQLDVDGAGHKVMNFARSLTRFEPEDRRVESVTRFEREPGAPSLRTAGLMLVHRDRGSALETRFAANLARNDLAEKVFHDQPGAVPPELWAEDLVRGFRVDVWDDRTGAWRSLCQREARYELDNGAVVVTPEPFEEGTLRLAATKSPDPAENPKLVYLHESLLTWTGWSLAAPLPGRAVLPDDTVDTATTETEAEVPDGIRVKTKFRALPGSLPRLRFGRRYWLRARVVDLAGNSLASQAEDFGLEKPEKHARPFLRYEPIAPPVIALVRPEGEPTERPAEGESMERVAIRSFNDTPADNTVVTDQVARRYAVPPQASVRDAELHGELDRAGAVDSATFDLLANQKDRDARDPQAALQEELLPMQGPLDPVAVDTVYAVYRDGRALTYLPDPLAREVAIRFVGHPDIAEAETLTVPLYAAGDWPEARPFKVRVHEDPGAAPTYDAESHTVVVPLPKGVRARMRLAMKPSPRTLELLGAWRWLSDADRAQLEDMALAGRHWMLTPWRTLELVHAVQRPLITPEITKHAISRAFGVTEVWPRFQATCSLESTDRLDLMAEWNEPSDDPAATESETVAANHPRGDVAFSVKITPPEIYAMRTHGQLRGGIPDHTIADQDRIGVGMPGHDLVTQKTHQFSDTRYRRIEYWLEGTTRFREFLPKEILTEEVADESLPTEKNIKVTGPRLVTWIPSSAPPPAPEVVYVVPTFGWERSVDDEGNQRSWRRGGGLRVYLDRPWMASGYGEMLAVVLPPSGFSGDPESKPKGAPYKKYVTQWANDPIWLSPFVSGVAPHRTAFPLARTAADPDGGWLPTNAPDTEKDQRPGAFQVDNLLPPDVPPASGASVEIAAHDVHYDEERRLWYCDIEIDQGASYFPFIRLALARYQPTSVTGAHLSNVVLADFMPLAADRWLNVNATRDSATRRVAVYGHSYRDSSGRLEAAGAPSMSVIDRLTGRSRLVEPADISGESVVEVWVEQLDEAKGEDFGWERAPHAQVQRDPEPGSGGLERLIFQRFRRGDATARAFELRRQGRHDLIVREGLIDHIFALRPLWSGQVTLPPGAPADRRHRLVIAEYEEYLVDDDRPYDSVPERKGRRLVFVEHLEL